MTGMWSCTLAGDPVPEGRPRASVIAGHAHLRADPKSKEWRRFAAQVFREKWDEAPLDGAVSILITAVSKRPKSLLRKKDPEGRMWCPKKPDADNIAKAVMDALVEGGVLRDDAYVTGLSVETLYAAKGEGPSVSVAMWELLPYEAEK